MAGRNVFVFFDGTNCQLSTNSNVARLRGLVSRSPAEFPYKDGPGRNHFWQVARVFSTLMGFDLDDTAKATYRELLHWGLDHEDRISVVGYSRGAITARIFVQMLTVPSVREELFSQGDLETIIRAQVHFVGLFDPVIGWPFLFKRKNRERQLAHNSHVHGYVEVIAMDERFLLFPGHSSIDLSSPSNRRHTGQGLAMPTPTLSATQEVQRKRLGRRVFIWMPGEHCDVGGQGGDQVIADHALLTMLDQMLSMSADLDPPLYVDRHLAGQHLNSVGMDNEVRIGKLGFRTILSWRRRKPQAGEASVLHDFAAKMDGRPNVFMRYFRSKRKTYKIHQHFRRLAVEASDYQAIRDVTG